MSPLRLPAPVVSMCVRMDAVEQARRTTLLRGFAAASVAVFAALAGHVSAGGAMPGLLGIVAPWLLSLMVCVLLAGLSAYAAWRMTQRAAPAVATTGAFAVLAPEATTLAVEAALAEAGDGTSDQGSAQ